MNTQKTKLKAEIKRTKERLKNEVAKKGLYENFGQKEVRKLSEEYIDTSKYTKEMNEMRSMIQEFDEWAMTYDGE